MNNLNINNYEFIKLIGRGSFGEAYLVNKFNELFACKVIETSNLDNEKKISLKREVLIKI